MKSRFMRGINIIPYHARCLFDELQRALKNTGIEWIRIHPLPTRRLEEGWLKAVENVCAGGYNIIVPIDVGVVDNVGVIHPEMLDDFVEESFEWSYRAASLISGVAERYGSEVIFGVENEIDLKEWILQSLAGWRADAEAWSQLGLNSELKYQRLNNILRGIRKAKPGARTMTNVEADDLTSYLPDERKKFARVVKSSVGPRLQTSPELQTMADWKVELGRIREKLNVDIVGLDNYPNYLLKLIIRGDEIGKKTDEAAQLTRKPVINCEFGFSTYRSAPQRVLFPMLGRPRASRDQQTFFRKALDSIRNSASHGAFPWVLVTQPYKHSVPPEEDGFGLVKLDPKARLMTEPAFGIYKHWLQQT